jgi:futalosine hydrolase
MTSSGVSAHSTPLEPSGYTRRLRILVVTATGQEVAPFAAELRAHPRHDVEILSTGVGMVATAAWCGRRLAQERFDLALNLGVCGSLDAALAPGTVVHVVVDCLSELGAEDGDEFLSLEQLNLLRHDPLRLDGQIVVNPAPPVSGGLMMLPAVVGITVNTVHGNERSIAAVKARLAGDGAAAGRPQVESMEGAAFMYACLVSGVPFAQVRAISNVVERRNRAAWKMEEAIRNLGTEAVKVLNTLPAQE